MIGIVIFVILVLAAFVASRKKELTLEEKGERANSQINKILKGYNLNTRMSSSKIRAQKRLDALKRAREEAKKEEEKAAEYLRNREAAKRNNIEAYRNRTL